MSTPHTCPVCGGQGTVSKPLHIAGDQNEWLSSGTANHPCPACGGNGVIWEPEYKRFHPLADNSCLPCLGDWEEPK